MRKLKELSNKTIITTDSEEKLTAKHIGSLVSDYLNSKSFKRLQIYDDYYQGDNSELVNRYKDKEARDVTPNNFVPTAYYGTIVDTMAGYMFSDVNYITESEDFLNVLYDNNVEIKDMNCGIRALAYNKGAEIVYTIGDGTTTEIKFSPLDPRQIIPIYTDDIEPQLFCAIRVMTSDNTDYDYEIDVIYRDLWEYYYIKDEKLTVRKESWPMFHKECPVVIYNTDDMSNRSSFERIIQYIDALDIIVTGNSNDMEKLTDAILVLSKVLKEEDLKHLDELKALMDIEPDERAEYLEKNMDPAFREYASRLIIQEIHKHAHVIDWYSPESGLSGEISAKAMRTRLFDMDMFSKRLEMVYRTGAEKRNRLINNILAVQGKVIAEDIVIEYKRTLPDEFIENVIALNQVTYISDKTKYEILGLNVEREEQRLEEQKTLNMERFNLDFSESTEDEEEE